MSTESDIVYNLSAFEEKNIDPVVVSLNKKLIELGLKDQKWWDVSAFTIATDVGISLCRPP